MNSDEGTNTQKQNDAPNPTQKRRWISPVLTEMGIEKTEQLSPPEEPQQS